MDTTPKRPKNVRKRPRPPTEVLPPDARPAKKAHVARQKAPGVDLKLRYVLFVVALMTGYCYWQMGPKEFHGALIKMGDYLPPALKLNKWFQSFHKESKDATPKGKDKKNFDVEQKKHDWMTGPSTDPGLKMFSLEEIRYTEGGPMYLVLIGHVFDVTGAEYYQPGSGYHAFIGNY